MRKMVAGLFISLDAVLALTRRPAGAQASRLGMLLRIRRSVAIRRPAHDVFAYVSDFNRAKEWRVEVRQSTLSPPGQVEPTGDSAELTYTLDVDLRGIWVAASPYLRWSGPRTMARSLERLRARLESQDEHALARRYLRAGW